MAYYSEDFTSSDTEEDVVEICEQDLFKTKVQNKAPQKIDFDSRVAKKIVSIHKQAYHKEKNRKFSNWVNDNLKYLEKLYQLSDLSVNEEIFYTFVYDHS
jgi:hypothetical protein